MKTFRTLLCYAAVLVVTLMTAMTVTAILIGYNAVNSPPLSWSAGIFVVCVGSYVVSHLLCADDWREGKHTAPVGYALVKLYPSNEVLYTMQPYRDLMLGKEIDPNDPDDKWLADGCRRIWNSVVNASLDDSEDGYCQRVDRI